MVRFSMSEISFHRPLLEKDQHLQTTQFLFAFLSD